MYIEDVPELAGTVLKDKIKAPQSMVDSTIKFDDTASCMRV